MGAIRQRVLVNFPSNAVIQGNANMAEGTIKKVMERDSGSSRQRVTKTCSFTLRPFRGWVSMTCVKARR